MGVTTGNCRNTGSSVMEPCHKNTGSVMLRWKSVVIGCCRNWCVGSQYKLYNYNYYAMLQEQRVQCVGRKHLVVYRNTGFDALVAIQVQYITRTQGLGQL